jgi:hypothetical protein
MVDLVARNTSPRSDFTDFDHSAATFGSIDVLFDKKIAIFESSIVLLERSIALPE